MNEPSLKAKQAAEKWDRDREKDDSIEQFPSILYAYAQGYDANLQAYRRRRKLARAIVAARKEKEK